VAGNPRRSGLFGVVPESRGLRRLDGGVCSQIRTGLDPQIQDNGRFAGTFHQKWLFCETLPEFCVDVHRLGSKFPKISIRDLFLEISESSGGNCELLRKSRPLLKRRFGLIMPHSVSFPTMQLFLQMGLHFDSERR
jgi:hypothetical protein